MPMGTESDITFLPSRRSFLGHAVALAASATAVDPAWATPKAPGRLPTPRVLTAWNRGEQSWAGIWTPGKTPHGIALPERAHQLLVVPPNAQRPQLQALVLARRPGQYLLRMDPIRNKALQWNTMEDDRYLGGHPVLSGNGATFFTTETDGDTGQGLVAERDLGTLEKIREFPSGGIGPHALLLEPAGSLLVANGGILNLPETGRRKLNIGSMDSSLTRLHAQSGIAMEQFHLPDPHLSLRHLAIATDGSVGVGLQAEHLDPLARQEAPALALLQSDVLRAVDWAPSQMPHAWDGYVGDICRFWTSAPHVGAVTSWSARGDALPTRTLAGAGALATKGNGVWVTGQGVALLQPKTAPSLWTPNSALTWDNHAALL
jgi:hypothetical protein